DAAGRDLRYQPHGSLRANGWALRSDPPTAAGAGKIHEPAAAARREPSTPGSKQIRGRSRPEYATCVLPPLPRGNDSTPGRTDSRTGLARVAPVVHGPRRLGGNAWRRVDTTSNPGDDPIDPLAPHPRPRRSPGRRRRRPATARSPGRRSGAGSRASRAARCRGMARVDGPGEVRRELAGGGVAVPASGHGRAVGAAGGGRRGAGRRVPAARTP